MNQLTELTPTQLSADLREGTSTYLQNRRGIVGLSILSAGIMGGIALYQMGVFKKLPDPPLPGFDGEKVNGSAEAYAHLAMPDALLGLASYAATACLAGMGSQNRWQRQTWIPIAMAAKVLIDAAIAGKLTLDQLTKHKAFCAFCLAAATANAVAIPLALPEAKAAIHSTTD